MRRTAGLRPSWGFVFLVSSHLLLISMLAWGYTKPELELVWLVLQRMQRDNFNGLSVPDARTIETSLKHYPELSRVFTGHAPIGFVEPTQDGWVSPSPQPLTPEVRIANPGATVQPATP
jgi:hypothetical protein